MSLTKFTSKVRKHFKCFYLFCHLCFKIPVTTYILWIGFIPHILYYVYIYQQLIVYEVPQEQPGIHCQKHTIRHMYVWKHVNTNNYRCFGVIN